MKFLKKTLNHNSNKFVFFDKNGGNGESGEGLPENPKEEAKAIIKTIIDQNNELSTLSDDVNQLIDSAALTNGYLNPQDHGALFVKFILENQDITISYTLKRASDLSNAAQAPFLESLKNYVWAFYYGAF